MLLFFASIISLAIAAFLQTTNFFLIGLVKPNLVFALLVVLAHAYKDWTSRIFLILMPALILKFSPALAWIDIIFIATAFLIIALVDYLPWRRLINSVVSVIIGTVIIGIPSFAFGLIIKEVGINIMLVIIFFLLMEWTYAKKAKSQTNRL